MVVKLPRTLDGFEDNVAEWRQSKDQASRGPDHVQLPRVRMGMQRSIPVLFMEYVAPMTGSQIRARFGAEPDWVKDVDGGQVGATNAGRLVAYDFGVR
jgi:hypothetical protein